MSQYGGQQQQGGQQGGQQGYGQQAQDPSTSQYGQQGQDPSASQYGQQGQDPSAGQQDPSQGGQDPSQQQDPSQMNGAPQGQANGYPTPAKTYHAAKPAGDEHKDPKEMMKKGAGGMEKMKLGGPHKKTGGSKRQYDHKHHNAMFHQGQVAAGGFTKEHMDSFIHLGTYAMGALGNQHGLTPDAPRDPKEDEEEEPSE